MEMHELEQAWGGLESRMAQQAELLQQLRRRDGFDRARGRLRLVTLGQVAQLVVGILIVVWAGGYWVGHLDELHLVTYGVALHLYGLGLLVTSAIQLARIARIDYRAPVLEVQRQLVALRRLRIASERALLAAGFVAWVPLVFIAMRGAGMDLWLTRPSVVLANLAVGLALAAFVGWLTHRFRAAFERDATGRSLREAEAEIAELS